MRIGEYLTIERDLLPESLSPTENGYLNENYKAHKPVQHMWTVLFQYKKLFSVTC